MDHEVCLLPLTLILTYIGGVVVSVVNTAFLQYRRSVYGGNLVSAHLAFSIISCIVFFCVSSVMWLWSCKYSQTREESRRLLCVGIWLMFLFKDLPLLIIETHALLQVGWRHGTFEDASYILQVLFFVPSALVSWLTISWYLAGFLEHQFGSIVKAVSRENIYMPPLAAETPSDMTAAIRHPPPLPMQDVHYTIAHSSHHIHPADYPIWSATPTRYKSTPPFTQLQEMSLEIPRSDVNHRVDHGGLGVSMNNPYPLSRKDHLHLYPTVI